MYKLYDFLPSGNAYKVRLLLTQLQIFFELIEINPLKKETRTHEFSQINPNGKIPVLEIAPNKFISESNAILYYLSQETEYFPQDKYHTNKYNLVTNLILPLLVSGLAFLISQINIKHK